MGSALVPGFPSTLDWLNAPTPGVARAGWLTAVAFVNVGSAWSLQALHELQALCARFPGRVRAMAIHVPRFDHERDPHRVRQRAQRHGVKLPLALDADWVAWQHFGITAWPTVLVVDGEGRLQARLEEGGNTFAELERRVQDMDGDAGDDEDLLQPQRRLRAEQPLCFPAGLAVTAQYLYVADSGHHRILECNHAGRVLRTFGSGDAGRQRRFAPHQRHPVHSAVARHASDALGDMDRMVEVDEIRQIMHALPAQRHPVPPALDQWREHGLVGK
jgi:hypothetical protein